MNTMAFELDWRNQAASWCLNPAGHLSMGSQRAGISWVQLVLESGWAPEYGQSEGRHKLGAVGALA